MTSFELNSACFLANQTSSYPIIHLINTVFQSFCISTIIQPMNTLQFPLLAELKKN
jgi:hypothetical protein